VSTRCSRRQRRLPPSASRILGRSDRDVLERRLHRDGEHGGPARHFGASRARRQGLPLGLQLIGRPFDEETLFALGEAMEQAAGTFTPEPWVGRQPLTG